MVLNSGGGGGNRTRVRKFSAIRSTCLAWPTEFDRLSSDRQDENQRASKFRTLTRDKRGC